jgi:hypothetical protein
MGKAKDDFQAAVSGRRARSETRRRTRMLTVRFSEPEAEIIRQLAERTGLSVGALIRRALLNAPPPASAQHADIDIKAIDDLLGKLEAIGTNVNQHTKRANMGRFDQGEGIREELNKLADLRLPCLNALGHERDDTTDADEPGSPKEPPVQP